jgi:prophage antirepressor-like protein
MGKVVKFEAHGKRYDLSIMDMEGGKWVPSQQLAEALGNTNIRKLMRALQERGELREGKHWCNVSLHQPGDTQARVRILLSYRGVIRVAMHSEGARAREFRDWAEDVLYQVMMTGHYEVEQALPTALEQAHCAGLRQGLALTKIAAGHSMPIEALARLIRFRRMGLTQSEAGVLFGCSKWKVQEIEADLREAGVHIKPINAMQRDKDLLTELADILAPAALTPALSQGEKIERGCC